MHRDAVGRLQALDEPLRDALGHSDFQGTSGQHRVSTVEETRSIQGNQGKLYSVRDSGTHSVNFAGLCDDFL